MPAVGEQADREGGDVAVAPDQPFDDSLVPRLDRRAFRHELTPHWLATATMLAGHRPFDVSRPFRYAWFGGRAVLTPAVAAAVHPGAEVVVWSPDPRAAATARRLGEDAELANLVVHDHPTPPTADAGRFDAIVIDEIVDAVDDRSRSLLVDAVAGLLRPGGVLCVTYRTMVGWGELVPIVRLVRYIAGRTTRDRTGAVCDAMLLLETLGELGAGYLGARPVVKAWVDDLLRWSVDDVIAAFVELDLRPVSHAQVAEAFAVAGLGFVGSARMDDVLLDGLPEALTDQVRAAPSGVLRETLADLALRRPARADLFTLGGVRVPPPALARWVHQLPITSFSTSLAPGAQLWAPQPEAAAPPAARRHLDGRSMPVGERWQGLAGDGPPVALRHALQAGRVHPVLAGRPDAGALRASARLADAVREADEWEGHRLLVSPVLATAVPEGAAMSDQHRRFLEGS